MTKFDNPLKIFFLCNFTCLDFPPNPSDTSTVSDASGQICVAVLAESWDETELINEYEHVKIDQTASSKLSKSDTISGAANLFFICYS